MTDYRQDVADWTDSDLQDAIEDALHPEMDPLILMYLYHVKGWSMDQIGDRFGVSSGCISYYCDEFDIETSRGYPDPEISRIVGYGDNPYTVYWGSDDDHLYQHQLVACLDNDPHEVFADGIHVDHKLNSGMAVDFGKNVRLLDAGAHTRRHVDGDDYMTAKEIGVQCDDIDGTDEDGSVSMDDVAGDGDDGRALT